MRMHAASDLVKGLTAQIMYDVRACLKAEAASKVRLVAVKANPTATSVAEVQA